LNNSISIKTCYKCHTPKPITEFNKCKTHKDGLGSYCKACIKLSQEKNKHSIVKYQKQYHIDNKESINERTRNHHFIHRYGISKEKADKLVEQCCGKCQICGVSLSESNPPHIDHNHETGVVRGILCRCCNSGLGLFKDSPDFLNLAIRYLKKCE